MQNLVGGEEGGGGNAQMENTFLWIQSSREIHQHFTN